MEEKTYACLILCTYCMDKVVALERESSRLVPDNASHVLTSVLILKHDTVCEIAAPFVNFACTESVGNPHIDFSTTTSSSPAYGMRLRRTSTTSPLASSNG
jgi:hypothetical protein